MTPWLSWMLTGIVLCGGELFHPGVFLLWIGLAAIAVGGATWATDLGFSGQIGTFLVALVASLCIPALLRRRRGENDGGVNAPDSGLVGKTCRALAFEGGEGRVSFRDGTWSARMSSGPAPVPGTILRVAGLDGTTLIVTLDET